MSQRWYQKVGVQVAIISGLALIIAALLPIAFQVPSLRDDIRRLERTVVDKNSEINRLETQLSPFRTIALEKYSGTEAEALRKLADQINALQISDSQKTARIEALSQDLQKAKAAAAPPTLSLYSQRVTKTPNGYSAILRFTASKSEHLGLLVFTAEVVNNTPAEILDFWPTRSGAFESGPDSKKISSDRKQARLIYSLMSASGTPEIELKTSREGAIRIRGNHDLEPFIVDIKNAEK
jgi:hypothetical protein